jgi:hypothetical protein
MLDIAPTIIVCIPGMWQERSDIITAIAASNDGWSFDGEFLHDTASNEKFGMAAVGYDAALPKAFSIAGRRSMSPDDIEAIKKHIQTVFLTGDGGSPERARGMMHAASALLRAGGLGVKVETAGVAHSPANWQALEAAPELVAVYHAYVSMVAAQKVYYSCGMHNLGLPDATVPRSLAPRDAARTLEAFLLYLLYESPDLSDTHTFSMDASSPRFKLQDNPCTMFPKEHPFYNPYGVWILH